MNLTDTEKAAIRQTQLSPGWAVIKDLAERRLEQAKIAALLDTDEDNFLRRYRHFHAVAIALNLFLSELEAEPQEPNEHNPEY